MIFWLCVEKEEGAAETCGQQLSFDCGVFISVSAVAQPFLY
jgi:hypothetical protein